MKGIQFSPEMVRALLDGRKTMTRREVKFPVYSKWSGGTRRIFSENRMESVIQLMQGDEDKKRPHPHDCIATKYKVGEVVYVKETWARLLCDNGYSDEESRCLDCQNCRNTVTTKREFPDAKERKQIDRWKSPASMPEWASRIKLRITEVRVERLQDISEEDAEQEGIKICNEGTQFACYWDYLENESRSPAHFGAIDCFYSLWESIKGVGSWDENPWVWVYSFEVAD